MTAGEAGRTGDLELERFSGCEDGVDLRKTREHERPFFLSVIEKDYHEHYHYYER